jgi:hypothetical protein
MTLRDLGRSDGGASMILVAMTLLLLLGASAVAVDLAAMRLDRSADQRVTDSAAAAGALAAFNGTGQDGCVAALQYVEANTRDINIGDLADPNYPTNPPPAACVPLDSACDVTTGARTTAPFTIGRYTITVTHPVPNGHDLMTSAQLGAPSQGVVVDDGEPCERVGVRMSAVHDSLFAQLLGFGDGTTAVHTVARAFLPAGDEPPLNLLVLDRTGCDAIHVRGQGGVIVKKVTNPDTGEEFPGVAAADSDASSGCVPSVLHAEGRGVLRADGPVCDTATNPGTGEGCGLVQTLAPGTPGCNTPACRIDGANAVLAPDPTALAQQITRAQVDYEFNCWGDYTNPPGGVWSVPDLDPGTGQNIPGCPNPSAPHIYDRIIDVGSSGSNGFSEWNACNIPASGSGVTIPGPAWINCSDFIIENDVVINGNVIFEGNVWVKSDGSLTVNNSPGWAFFRGGYLRKDGQASLAFRETMVYLSQTSWTQISGGSGGTLIWVAPESGDFENLALWSDSPHTHFWSGQGNLTMEGVFFTPWARADYSGTSQQNQTNAQWVAHSLEAHGQGKLEITPKFEFPVKLPDSVRTTIIR